MKLIFATVMTGLVICVALAEGRRITNSNKTSYDAGYAEGSQKSIGQPIQYKNLPGGRYEVVVPIDDEGNGLCGACIAVVKTIPTFASDKSRYFLVTDMAPGTIGRHHSFRIVGPE